MHNPANHANCTQISYMNCKNRLHPTRASWPFDAWGLDMVGLMPKLSEGHVYILAATDYFSKWAEAVPLLSGKKEEVADFIKSYLIYRYRVPRCIITDNGKSFV
ncbi:hypothetical protein LIER_27406 [Lithospermum erythrorhizon]|uniref:Integrase catalytic domain-containing protein n=1 Tax=Lithospermum erythrorhizon TaxID=34254 RepID=A0AAV3RBX6_LITER